MANDIFSNLKFASATFVSFLLSPFYPDSQSCSRLGFEVSSEQFLTFCFQSHSFSLPQSPPKFGFYGRGKVFMGKERAAKLRKVGQYSTRGHQQIVAEVR